MSAKGGTYRPGSEFSFGGQMRLNESTGAPEWMYWRMLDIGIPEIEWRPAPRDEFTWRRHGLQMPGGPWGGQ